MKQAATGVMAIAAVLTLACTLQIQAETTRFQEGVAPTGGYSHDAVMIRSRADNNADDTNHDGGSVIIGLAESGSERIRGLFAFDISAIPYANRIESVSLELTTLTGQAGINNVGGAGALTTFDLYAYGFGIDETTATWNAPGAGDGTPGGTFGALLSSVAFDVEVKGQTVIFPDSAAFRAAVSSALAGDGVLRMIIANSDESNLGTHDFARTTDNEDAALANRPRLVVTHGILADYTFPGGDGTSADSEPNSTAADFEKNPSSADWGFSGSSDNAFARSSATTASEADAITAGDYFSFTVTPDPGYELNLTQLAFDTTHNQTWHPATPDTGATMNLFVRSSVDSFAANVGPTHNESWGSTTSRSVDLSGPAFQDLVTATEFRIYIYDSGVDLPENGARLDNVVLSGSVGVRENTIFFQEGVWPDASYTHHATFIHAGAAGPYGTDPRLIAGVGSGGDVIRILLKFDISSIPYPSVIDAASLTFTTTATGAGGNNTFNLHTYAYDFTEGTATWNAPGGGAPAGGDISGTLLASATFDTTAVGLDVTFSDTTAFRTAVADAIAGDGSLRLILANSNESTASNYAQFQADEVSPPEDRPRLVVTFRPSVGTLISFK